MATTGSASGHGALLDRTAYARVPLSGQGVLSADIPSPLEPVMFEVTGFFSVIGGITSEVQPLNNIVVTFAARLARGQLIFTDDAVLSLRPAVAVISGGVLSTYVPPTWVPDGWPSENAPTPGFELVANTPALNLAANGGADSSDGMGGLIYDCSFADADGNQALPGFAFYAPQDSTSVCITDADLAILPWQPPSQVIWSPPPPVEASLTVVGANNWSQRAGRWAS